MPDESKSATADRTVAERKPGLGFGIDMKEAEKVTVERL